MKDAVKKFWQLIKAGIVPLFVAAIPFYLAYLLWIATDKYGLHLLGKSYYDVPISLATIIVTACICGYVVSRAWFVSLAKEYLLDIPLINWLVVIFILPKRKLNIVEMRTVWGPTPEESAWEYGMETCDPWVENGTTWHRVHTISWAGKLYPRVGDANVRPVNKPPHKVWLTIFSLGIL